jgi:hypothetical protein
VNYYCVELETPERHLGAVVLELSRVFVKRAWVECCMAFGTGLEAGRLRQTLNRFGQCSRSQSRQAARVCFGLEALECHSVMVVIALAQVPAKQMWMKSYLESGFE